VGKLVPGLHERLPSFGGVPGGACRGGFDGENGGVQASILFGSEP